MNRRIWLRANLNLVADREEDRHSLSDVRRRSSKVNNVNNNVNDSNNKTKSKVNVLRGKLGQHTHIRVHTHKETCGAVVSACESAKISNQTKKSKYAKNGADVACACACIFVYMCIDLRHSKSRFSRERITRIIKAMRMRKDNKPQNNCTLPSCSILLERRLQRDCKSTQVVHK